MTTTMTIQQFAAARGLDEGSLLEIAGDGMPELAAAKDYSLEFLEATAARLAEITDEAAVADLVEAREDLEDARQQLRACEENLQRAVREALDDGVPATKIAKTLSVSRARVYQLRDGTR